jgi:hypothetical protein
MVWLMFGASTLGKTPYQVNTQAQRDDLKHILQKAIPGLRPQSPRQKNHNQTKNDAQHEVDRVGFLGNLCVFAHGLAPVVAGWIKGLTLTSPSPPAGLVFSSTLSTWLPLSTSADGLMTYLSPWALKAGQWGTRIRPHPKFNHLID